MKEKRERKERKEWLENEPAAPGQALDQIGSGNNALHVPVPVVGIEDGLSEDQRRLHELGIEVSGEGVLPRQFSLFQTFGLVLTNTSMIIGVIPLYSTGLGVGGPVALVWGWLLTSLLTLCTAACLAEICSAYPTAGGLYYYSARLSAGKPWSPFAAFSTAWLNLLGQLAGVSGSVYAGAIYFNILLTLVLPDNTISPSLLLKGSSFFVTFCIFMLFTGLCNSGGGRSLKVASFLSVMLHSIVILALLFALIICVAASGGSKHFQTPSFVFTKFLDETGWTDQLDAPPFFVFLLGLLPSAWTQIGYDSSAHLSEETHSAHLNGPRAIMLTVGSSIITGLLLILAMTFCIQDGVVQVQAKAGLRFANQVPVQIFYDAGGPLLAALFCACVAGAGFLCGVGTVAANSRAAYAFARDDGLPFSKYLVFLDKKNGMPIRLVWISVIFSTLLSLPALFSSTVLNAVSALSIIGFTLSYAVPIFLRITVGKFVFKQAEFNLGKHSSLVGFFSICWTLILVIVLQMPNAVPAFPLTPDSFNYTPIVMLLLCTGIGAFWVCVCSKYFTGPHKGTT